MFLNRLKGRVREYIKVNISHHYVAGPVVAGVIERNDKQKSEINYEDKVTCLIDVQDLKDVMNIQEKYFHINIKLDNDIICMIMFLNRLKGRVREISPIIMSLDR